MTPATALQRGLEELGMPLPMGAATRLQAFLALLAKWNRTFNLTAVRDPLSMVTHHLLDSLAVLPLLPDGRLADVGTGAGLPGVPIAIVQPDRSVTLNDSSGKRCAFLRQAIIELGLANVQVHAGRAENWHPLERFDVVISRGFSELRKLVATSRHLLVSGGMLAAMKGAYPGRELEELSGDCDCGDVRRIRVPLLTAERHLVRCTFRT